MAQPVRKAKRARPDDGFRIVKTVEVAFITYGTGDLPPVAAAMMEIDAEYRDRSRQGESADYSFSTDGVDYAVTLSAP